MSNMKDVAELAGVSTATVSRVLSNKPHVRPKVRTRVLEAVEALNYRPNLVARRLRSQKSNILGLIVADIRNPFFTDISRAVEDTAYADKMNVFLCNTDENPDKEESYINLMRDENVDGVIIALTHASAKTFHTRKLGFPLVVVDRAVEVTDRSDYDLILIDNVGAAYRLTSHLIKNGFRNIAGIFGANSFTGQERLKGYKKALSEHELPIKDFHIKTVRPKQGAGQQAAEDFLNMADRPDAILTSNSLLTAGAMQSILEAGLKIPQDIGLVGFDDAPWMSLVQPQITVIAQPTLDIGHMATNMLVERINNPSLPPREVLLKGRLIVRGSSTGKNAQNNGGKQA